MSVVRASGFIGVVALLAGCDLPPANCEAGQARYGRSCVGTCRTQAPPCVQDDGGVLLPEAGAEDAAMDASVDVPVDAGPVCEAGTSACSGSCVNVQSDRDHCGRCGNACPAAVGERALCAMGQCATECLAGFERMGMGACEVMVPRLIGPMSTSYVSSQRPTLRWSLPMGVDGAAVEVCASRDCAMVLQRGVVSGGATSWRVDRALSAGVYWWRVRGRAGSTEGTRASSVWEFVVGARDRGTDTQWGTLTDVNGDGFGDVVVGSGTNTSSGWTGGWIGYWGRSSGPSSTASWSFMEPRFARDLPASAQSAGDVNGDGFGDVVLGAAGAQNSSLATTGSVYLFLGSASGLSSVPQQIFGESDGERFGAAVSAAGDVNGDGYGDVVVGAPRANSPAIESGRALLYLGSAGGLSATAALVFNGVTRMGHFGAAVSGAHDFDADHRPDLIVAAPDSDDPVEGEPAVGVVQYFRGTMDGFTAMPARAWTRVERVGDIASGLRLGASISRAGDVNGDGLGDVVLGGADARIRRDVLLVLGTASGLPASFGRVESGDVDARLVGRAVDVGDVTGDGFDDIIVGSSDASTVSALTTVRLGSVSGAAATETTVVGGLRAGVCSDVNGDGISEVFVVRSGNPGGLIADTVRIFAGNRSNTWGVAQWELLGSWAR